MTAAFPLPSDQPWRALAACQGAGPEIFYPERGEDVRPAKAICAGCPVQSDCLDYALSHNEAFGIWGGCSERERRTIRRKRRNRARGWS